MQNRTEPNRTKPNGSEQNRTDEMKLYKISLSVWPYYVNLSISDIRETTNDQDQEQLRHNLHIQLHMQCIHTRICLVVLTITPKNRDTSSARPHLKRYNRVKRGHSGARKPKLEPQVQVKCVSIQVQKLHLDVSEHAQNDLYKHIKHVI